MAKYERSATSHLALESVESASDRADDCETVLSESEGERGTYAHFSTVTRSSSLTGSPSDMVSSSIA